ncbi:MAG: hypothetical protein COS82_05760 [Zetaproteobacteria bacterium CG06_land_8_20_14_3_00_59_53]|nr:MAG: hypothetical protein COS82_05760 [Zetaproteobacteria bacterium CG06_land_8_20_14_3_00_59_53]
MFHLGPDRCLGLFGLQVIAVLSHNLSPPGASGDVPFHLTAFMLITFMDTQISCIAMNPLSLSKEGFGVGSCFADCRHLC